MRSEDVETGSSYKLCWEQGRDVIPTARPRFWRMPRRVEHIPTSIYARLYRIQHGELKTGSTYKLGCEQDTDAIPTASPRFSLTSSPRVHCLASTPCMRSA